MQTTSQMSIFSTILKKRSDLIRWGVLALNAIVVAEEGQELVARVLGEGGLGLRHVHPLVRICLEHAPTPQHKHVWQNVPSQLSDTRYQVAWMSAKTNTARRCVARIFTYARSAVGTCYVTVL